MNALNLQQRDTRNGSKAPSNSDPAFEPAKMAPHSQEAEEYLLGSILINPDCFDDVAMFLKYTDFFILRNSWIWQAMTALKSNNEVITYLTVIEILKNRKQLDKVGGVAYITYLTSNVGFSGNAETYGRLIERCAIRRKLLDTAADIAKLAREEDLDINQVIDQVTALVQDATERNGTMPLAPDEETQGQLFGDIDAMERGELTPVGLATYTRIDQHLTGNVMEPGVWLVTADTSGAKSLFMNNWFFNAGLAKRHVGYFTLEMTKKSLYRRILARLSGTPLNYLAIGKILDKVAYNAARIRLLEVSDYLLIDDKSVISIFEIMTKIRRAKREFDIAGAFVDYAGLIDEDGLDEEKRYKKVGMYGKLLHSLGVILQIPIVLAAQQGRHGDGIKGIAESYELAQHAQGVFYICESDKGDGIQVRKELRIEKQRDGRRGVSEFFSVNLSTQAILD